MARKTKHAPADKVWGLTRISLGLVFLWAFFDKLFGLGYATCRNTEGAVEVMCKLDAPREASSAWLQGGSPTYGFLNFGTDGPLADFYQSLASTNPNALVNWLFMLGLLGIGIGLTFGIAMKLSAISGAIMMILMWSAALWPANNPFIDDHIVYALVLVGLLLVNNKQAFGYGKAWAKSDLVKNYPILK